ncbi:MAG: DEAD/DEAH box helicase [Dietzia sp.]
MSGCTRRLWIKVPWWDESTRALELSHAVLLARERGVEVALLCRPEASNDAVLRKLRRAGVSITGIRYIHEKEVLADDVAVQHSMNFTSMEIERNQNSGLVFRDPLVVAAVEAGFHALLQDKAAAALGEEAWTPVDTLIPPSMQKFLTRFDRLNPLQSKAVPSVLTTSGHVMVVAPTSAGKSLIGEVAALRAIVLEGKPAVWLLPARALAAEVGETVRRWEALGIRSVELTGETNMSSEAVRGAQLWVATTEKFEALYRRSSLRSSISSLGCLIIDEVHLVGDAERGATLEALLARLRTEENRTRIVALSATVANAGHLADWFNAQLVTSAWRPTILTTQLVPYDAPPEGSRRELVEAAKDRAVEVLLRDLLKAPGEKSEILDGGPGGGDAASVLVFCGSKNAVRRTAAVAAGIPGHADSDDALVEAAFARGVGMHFRDAPRAGRALEAFRQRTIKTLVATSGLSTGVNTPARAVIIRDLELGMSPLEVSQAQQMFGRAGRAGQENAGFGFMLVPRTQEVSWRAKLSQGYTAKSRVQDRLDDVLLAEILLGSVVNRGSALTWFEGTFAFAQSGRPTDIENALEHLVRRGFVAETDEGLAATDLGKLTSRLMIDVESAGALVTALADLPTPAGPAEAEELLLQTVVTRVRALREWPVNQRVYDPLVSSLLSTWAPHTVSRVGDHFGARFCMAAAHLALRQPRRLHSKPPQGMSQADFRRAIEQLPRYLSWVAALGYLQAATWAPAVAGDLARRLTWWQLSPHPERGAGRLLWMLEELLDPENRRLRMQDLWSRARRAGFLSPDGLTARPRAVDATAEEFTQLLGHRADFTFLEPDGLRLSINTRTADARLTAVSSTGNRRAMTTAQPPTGSLELPLPTASREGDLAADLFLYTQRGDFSYRSVVTRIPVEAAARRTLPVVEAHHLVAQLPDVVSAAPRVTTLQRFFRSERHNRLATAMPHLAPDHRLRPVALTLSGNEADPEVAVVTLRENLAELLVPSFGDVLRPPTAVLRSGWATEEERELVLSSLAASLHIESGLASAGGSLRALVRIGEYWKLAGPLMEGAGRIEPLHPPSLPPLLETVRMHPPSASLAVRPTCEWIRDFAPS